MKLFPIFRETHTYTLEEVYSICQSEIDSENKFSKKYQVILDNREIVDLNYDLMELQDANVNLRAIEMIESQLKLQKPRFNPFQLRLMFTKDAARDQIENFDWWTRSFIPLNYKG